MKTHLFFIVLPLIYFPVPLTATTQAGEPDLAAWLAEHPLVSETIRWQDSNGPTRAYPNWSETQKADLYETYQAVWSGQSLELTDPPPNMRHLADDQSVVTVLSKDHAWSLFLAHVAYSLAVETGRWVPWSLTEYSREELLELFDGSRTFRRTSGGYELIHRAVPAPPDATFEFLSANLMIGQDQLHTIGNLLEWSRANLIHFTGHFRAKNAEDHWQYRGVPPVSRVISGTRAVFYPYKKGDTSPPTVTFGHHTAGCWGTTAFLRAVLRVVNIPVKEVNNSRTFGHSIPYFVSEGQYLSHGDDPYGQNTRSSPGFPIEELFIDQATYDAWFGPGVSLPQGKSNVSRRASDLAIKYLPRTLLVPRCRDIREGRSHSNSHVIAWIPPLHYSVQELEAIKLWDRIDAKIDELGGCPIENSWIVFEPPSLTIVKISGPTTESESRLVVAVRDSEGQPIEGHLVTFTVTSGDGTLSVTRTTTDADGRAESRLTRGPDAGMNSVSAFAAGVEQPVIFTAAGQAIPQSLTKVSGNGQQGPAGTALAAPFVISVLDEDGEAIAGAVVTFSVTAGGGTLSATTATTDANGRARSTLTLGSEPGTNTVATTVEGLGTETFTAIGQATADSDGDDEQADDEQAMPQSLTKVSGEGQAGQAGTTLAEPFVVSVLDQNGSAYAGAVVTFSVTAGGGALSSTTATTNASGQARSTLTLGSDPGPNTVSATVDGLEPVAFTATATAIEQTPHSLTKVSSEGQAGQAGATLAEPFVVSVLDEDGAAIAGAVVTFSVTAGGGMLSSTTATTDANGRARSTLTLGSQPGTNTVTATVTELESVTFTASGYATPHSLTKVSGEGQEGSASTQLAEPFVVSVLDEDGAAIAGAVVTFSVTAGGGTLSSTTATTDANGRARSTLTLGSQPGLNAVAATVAGLESATFTASGYATPHSLTKVSGEGQEGPASTQLAEPFVVSVLDQDGAAIAGASVTFSVTAGEGVLSSTTDANPCIVESSTSSATATTDANGRAATRLTLGSEPGSNTVAATVEGLELVTFTATAAEQAMPHSLTKVCGEDQEGTAGILLDRSFVVSVSDEDDAALAGVVVTFSVTAGGGTLSSATATTDANGRAATRLTLGSEPGTNTVEATVEGLEPVTFTAIGQASPLVGLFDIFGSGKRVALPDSPQLAQNVPNPFNSQTVLSYFLHAPGPAHVEVFALTGQRVAVLQQGPQQAGYHRLRWNGRDDAGRPVASGMYLYRLVTEEVVLTRKLILLR